MLTFLPRHRAPLLPIPTTPAEIWEAYEIDVLACRAALPRTWRDWCHLPLTEDQRVNVTDAFIGRRSGAPLALRLWVIIGALLAHDWRDARLEAGALCEKVPGLFHVYIRIARPVRCLARHTRFAWWFLADPLWRRTELLYWHCCLLRFWLECRRLGQPHADLRLDYQAPATLPVAPLALLLAALWPVLWLLMGGRP